MSLSNPDERDLCSDLNDITFRPAVNAAVAASSSAAVIEPDQDEDTPLLSNMSLNMGLTTGSPSNSYNGTANGATDDHCHSLTSHHGGSESRNASAQKRFILAIGMTTVFVIGEIIGGVMSNSLAILGDAAHMSSDLASFVIGLVALKLSEKRSSKKYNFGYHRAEALGALLTVVLIWYLTGFLLYEAVTRLINQDFEVEPVPMMIVAICAVLFNITLLIVLGGAHGHSHGGGSSHGHSHLVEEDDDVEGGAHSHSLRSLLNVRAAVIHVIGDFLQSIGVLASSIIIKIWPEAKIADPICTIIFAIIVGFTTIKIFLDTIHILMEGLPKSISYEDVQQDMLDLPGVLKVHDLRIWALTSDRAAASCHVVVASGQEQEKLLQRANKLLRAKYSVQVATIQVEENKPEVMTDCVQCQPIA